MRTHSVISTGWPWSVLVESSPCMAMRWHVVGVTKSMEECVLYTGFESKIKGHDSTVVLMVIETCNATVEDCHPWYWYNDIVFRLE